MQDASVFSRQFAVQAKFLVFKKYYLQPFHSYLGYENIQILLETEIETAVLFFFFILCMVK